MKSNGSKAHPRGPSKSPKVSINATKGKLKGSGGDAGRAQPPQAMRVYKPKGNP